MNLLINSFGQIFPSNNNEPYSELKNIKLEYNGTPFCLDKSLAITSFPVSSFPVIAMRYKNSYIYMFVQRCIGDGPCMWYMILPDTSTDVLEMGPVCGT